MTQPSGILRLPDELLGEICVQVLEHNRAVYEYELEYHKNTRVIFYEWLRVTHVCRRWRNAALATPRLWAAIRVKLTNLECFAMQLSRSGGIPLDVKAGNAWDIGSLDSSDHPEEHPVATLAELLWCNMHRVEKLTIAASSALCKVLSSSSSVAAPDAPYLRFLRVGWNTRQDIPPPPIPLLSSASLPNLTHLMLGGTSLHTIYLKSLIRSSVTRLEVFMRKSGVSIAAWLDVFRSLPNLEWLTLSNAVQTALPPPTFQRPPPSGVANMPRLSQIVLLSDSGIYLTGLLILLNHIDAHSAELSLWQHVGDLNKRELEYMWAVLNQKARNSTRPRDLPPMPARCVFDWDHDGSNKERVFISFAEQTAPLRSLNKDTRNARDAGKTGKISLLSSHSDVNTCFRSLCESPFPMSNVHQVKLGRIPAAVPADNLNPVSQNISGLGLLLARLSDNMTELSIAEIDDHKQVLEVFERLLETNARHLSADTDAHEDVDDGARRVFPKLSTIQLLGANWCRHLNTHKRDDGLSSAPTHSAEPLAEQLTRILAKWAAQTADGRILDTLIVSAPMNIVDDDITTIETSGTVKHVVRQFHSFSRVGLCRVCKPKVR